MATEARVQAVAAMMPMALLPAGSVAHTTYKRPATASSVAHAAAPSSSLAGKAGNAGSTTMLPALMLATTPGLMAQQGPVAALSVQPWGATALLRQHTNMAPHMVLQQAMGEALVGPAMMQAGKPGSSMSEAKAAQEFSAAMADAAQTMKKAHLDDTVKARQRVAADAQECFSKLPPSWGVSLVTAGPEHIVYWARLYSKEHAGTVMPNGDEVAAPGSLQCAMSHLSTAMKILGRSGAWDPETRKGNPVESPVVRLFLQGYEKKLRQEGYEEGSAVPWEEHEIYAVIDQLDKEASAFRQEAKQLLAAGKPFAAVQPTMKGLMLDRDATAVAYEWEGLQRGKEGGALTKADFKDEHGQEVLSRLPALLQLAPEKIQVHVYPYGIKQRPFVRVDTPVEFGIQSSVPWKYQFIPRLEQHLRLCDEAQEEIPWKQFSVQNYILRPSKGLESFVDKAWSSSGIYSRAVEAAERAGVYRGQSVHGFRRGGMQHRKYKQGESTEAIQEQAHIKTPAVAARYLNQHRHLPKLTKLANKVQHKGAQSVSKRMLNVLQKHGMIPTEKS